MTKASSDWREQGSESLGRRARRIVVRGILLLVVLALLGAVGTFAVERSVLKSRVMRGVEVAGSSFAGLERAGADDEVAELEDRLAKVPQPVRVNGRLLDLPPDKVGYRVDVEETFARALRTGRDQGLLRDFLSWVLRFREPARVPAVGQLDRAAALEVIGDWEQKMVDVPFAGGVKLEGEVPKADPPRAGHLIDREATLMALRAALGNDSREVVEVPLVPKDAFAAPGAVEDAEKRAQRLLSGPVTLLGPGEVSLTLDKAELAKAFRSVEPSPQRPEVRFSLDPKVIEEFLADLRSKVQGPPKDARFYVDESDHVRVQPGRAGTIIEAGAVAEAALQAASAPARVGELPIRHSEPPKVTTEALEALGIRELVGKYTTQHVCCQPRVDNIHRIADLLRGVVVKPGETFSVNAFIGPRDAKSGFKAAPTIEEGEMVDSLGGGISQFATTLFNALFLGGYDIIERVPHTYYFSRYPMGRDATLSWPKPDVSFKNDTAAGALIWTEYTGTSITVKVFGDGGGRKVSFRVSPQQDITQPPVEYIPDITQPPEKDKTKEPGQIGWTVFVTREVRFADGTKKEEKRKVTYKARVKRLVVHPCKVPEGEPGHTGEKCPDLDGGVDGG